jgi:hypothetical protein
VSNIEVETVPALVSDQPCSACHQLLGSNSFWCLTCNEYAEGLIERPCPGCGTPRSLNSRRTFCRPSCRVRHEHRQQHRQPTLFPRVMTPESEL